MKARGAAIQGTLALGGLIAAYAAWQREPQSGAEEVIVLDISKSELEQVRFDDGLRFTVLTPDRGLSDPLVWMKSGLRPVPPVVADGGRAGDGGTVAASGAADAGTGVDGGTAPVARTPERELKANDQAERLMERFTPLRASRALGALGPDKLKELGLEGSHRTLEIVARGTPHAFTVSSGPNAPYLLDTQSGRVYLVGASLLSDLDAASTRLVDRRLHTFKQAEYEASSIQMGDKHRELTQTLGESGQVTRVATRGSDKADDFARNWLDKVWRLLPTEVLGRGELPPGGAPPVQLRIDYLARGKVKGWVELARVQQDLYVRTEYTASWAKVHGQPDELLAEATKVVSGQ